MSSNEPNCAIEINNVSKRFVIFERPFDRVLVWLALRVKGVVPLAIAQRLNRYADSKVRLLPVISQLSLRIEKGSTVGLIGRNGAGKSTLLQLICGTLYPDSGEIKVNGKLAALLELGSGFNPNYTGRENVYFNGSLLGLTKQEIDEKFSDIEKFADIGQYIDHMVSTYSSGMFVRLAFAVAAHVNADILVIDEALAVGDVFFQQKCLRYLRNFQAKGNTVIFVSHDTASVSNLCDTAVLLYPGAKRSPYVGKPELVVREYLAELYSKKALDIDFGSLDDAASAVATDVLSGTVQSESIFSFGKFALSSDSFGNSQGKILDAWFEDDDGRLVQTTESGQRVVLAFKTRSDAEVVFPAWGFMLKDRLGQYLFTESTDLSYRESQLRLLPGYVVTTRFGFVFPPLARGTYSFNLAFGQGIGADNIQLHWIHDAIVVDCVSSRVVHGLSGAIGLKTSLEFDRTIS